MTRDSFVFYRSFIDCVDNLPEDMQLSCLKAVIKYALDGEEPQDGMPAAVLALAKPIIDINSKRYENGRKGGRPKQKPNDNQTETEQKPNDNQTETEAEPYVSVSVYDSVSENVNESVKDNKKHKRVYAQDERLDTAIREFIKHRQKMRKPMTDHAVDLLLTKLAKITTDIDEQVKLLDTAIEKGWQTVYPPKEETRTGSAYMDAIANRVSVVDSWV